MMSTCQTNIDRDIVPLQPELSQQLHYSERLLKWNPYSKKNLALCYQFQTGRDGTPIRLIPDACIDFLFKCDRENPVAVVSGVQTAPGRAGAGPPDSVYFGLSHTAPRGCVLWARPGTSSPTPRSPWRDDLRDAGWIAERLAAQETFDQRIAAIADFARLELTDDTYTPDFVELSELQLCQARGNIRMEVISDYTGYTGRYCREKFKGGPRHLHQELLLHHALPERGADALPAGRRGQPVRHRLRQRLFRPVPPEPGVPPLLRRHPSPLPQGGSLPFLTDHNPPSNRFDGDFFSPGRASAELRPPGRHPAVKFFPVPALSRFGLLLSYFTQTPNTFPRRLFRFYTIWGNRAGDKLCLSKL